MRVLVTGSRGYLGRSIVGQLVEAGHEVVPFAGDVRTADIPSSDGVIHLAALARVRESFEDPLSYYDVNVTGTLRLLKSGAPRFVFASTAGVYGTPRGHVLTEEHPRVPTNPYAATKAAAEDALAWTARTGALSAATLRLFNLAGGGDRDETRVVTRACAVAAGRLPSMEVYGDGSAVRDFVHVADAARAFVLALEHRAPGHEAYNVGATPASVADVLAAVHRVTGVPVTADHRPAHPGETREMRADTTKLRALGWRPVESDLDSLVGSQWAAEGPHRTA
ncbi:NAD-dependent epimerase/dehydratase family protein [Actinosynnema sp. NPDC047251]|uniref:UDP-glucose 4-epimerase n=1 Tax=Saccharothrix espanaensis (strain ATCC 51144 / DSM 44229 / JCM 9112 / NBRC 15066 / NRRL 15764) TaxID=1179773 RepID=K3W493_SACES|nr:NAD-dependent epimerase/dehydratase family protein [Saccharothrix espanaensis]CCH27543.1 NAD-dependent epimerase/dehydratase [Saccharothrix espanaensis DSM 44229]